MVQRFKRDVDDVANQDIAAVVMSNDEQAEPLLCARVTKVLDAVAQD